MALDGPATFQDGVPCPLVSAYGLSPPLQIRSRPRVTVTKRIAPTTAQASLRAADLSSVGLKGRRVPWGGSSPRDACLSLIALFPCLAESLEALP